MPVRTQMCTRAYTRQITLAAPVLNIRRCAGLRFEQRQPDLSSWGRRGRKSGGPGYLYVWANAKSAVAASRVVFSGGIRPPDRWIAASGVERRLFVRNTFCGGWFGEDGGLNTAGLFLPGLPPHTHPAEAPVLTVPLLYFFCCLLAFRQPVACADPIFGRSHKRWARSANGGWARWTGLAK